MISLTLASVGLMFIVKYGTILNQCRVILSRFSILKKLLSCSLCLGFWCGLFLMLMDYLYSGSLYVYLPLISAGVCWFSDNLNNCLQRIDVVLEQIFFDEK